MKIWTRQLYNVKNKKGDLEYHFRTYHIDFKSKNQTDWILFYSEDWFRICMWAEVIFPNPLREFKKKLKNNVR